MPELCGEQGAKLGEVGEDSTRTFSADHSIHATAESTESTEMNLF